MASTFTIKQGNRRPYLKLQLVRLNDDDEVEGPANLTDVDTITFTLMNKATLAIQVEKGPDVDILDDPLDGFVQYRWQAGDTDVAGKFLGEFDVLYTDGEEETFPNKKKGFAINIVERLS